MELPDMVEIKLREPRSYRVAENRSGKRRPNDDPLSLRRQANLARRFFLTRQKHTRLVSFNGRLRQPGPLRLQNQRKVRTADQLDRNHQLTKIALLTFLPRYVPMNSQAKALGAQHGTLRQK